MSDTPEGLGWWKASDGKWYPPEQRQDSQPVESPTEVQATTLAPEQPGGPPPVATPWWRSGWALAVGAVVLLLAGFGMGALLLSSDDEGDGEAAVETTPTETPTPQQTETPTPTATDEPTPEPTEAPTEEPTATVTTEPTEEPTETPDPDALEFSGSGADEILLEPPLEGEPLIITTEHVGSGNFIVKSLDEFDENSGFYANAIDSWFGTVPMNWNPGDTVAKITIDAGGDWTIVIRPRSEAPEASTGPGATYEGSSFEVLRFEVNSETGAEFDCPDCRADVVINAHGEDLFENLVEDEADGGFSATLEIPAGTEFLEIRAFAEFRATLPGWTLTAE